MLVISAEFIIIQLKTQNINDFTSIVAQTFKELQNNSAIVIKIVDTSAELLLQQLDQFSIAEEIAHTKLSHNLGLKYDMLHASSRHGWYNLTNLKNFYPNKT